MYEEDGTTEEFFKLKPSLCDFDKDLLNAYYRARRDASYGKKISKADLLKELEICFCESDIGVLILQKVDDRFLELQSEKALAERNRVQSD